MQNLLRINCLCITYVVVEVFILYCKNRKKSFLDCISTIDGSDNYHIWRGFPFYPHNVLENNCDSVEDSNYWIGQRDVSDIGFSIDRNCQQPFNVIVLKNTHNGHFNSRSKKTNYYQIHEIRAL